MIKASSCLKPALFILMFFICLSLWAQSGRYVIEQRYVDQLAWVKDDSVLRYEVVIERDDGQGYKNHLREFTVEPQFQISLLPGKYRYCVIPYDYFDQPWEASAWTYLDVSSAPAVPGSPRSDELVTPDEPEPEPEPEPAPEPEAEAAGEIEPAVVKGFKNDAYLEVLWAPVFPFFGEINDLFGGQMIFSSVGLRVGLISAKPKTTRHGLELFVSLYSHETSFSDSLTKIQSGAIDLFYLFHHRKPGQDAVLNLRLGGGAAFQTGSIEDYLELYLFERIGFHLSVDTSWLIFITKKSFVEAGINYTYFLASDSSSGYLRPWLGIGFMY